MRRIACINQKGGSGKTTTAVNLAAALGASGQRVLLIDLDSQASATGWLMSSKWLAANANAGRELIEALQGERKLEEIVRQTPWKNVSILAASGFLLGADKRFASEPGAELILRKALKKLSGFDIVLIDCPPTLGFLSVSALAAADEVLIPVESRTMALTGLASLMQTIDTVRDRLNEELKICGILVCRLDARTNLSKDILESLRERFGKQVFDTVIRENVRLAEAPSFGKPISHYDSRSSGAEDYASAARELLKRKGK